MRAGWVLVLVASQAAAGSPALAPCPVGDLTPLRAGFEDDVRWPLDREPTLEPRYDLTHALRVAQWSEACDTKAAMSDPLRSYLRGWCEVRDHHPARALDSLRYAAAGKDGKLAIAAGADLVDVLADAYSGDEAYAWLEHEKLATGATLDRLATTYLERGKQDNAIAIDRHLAGQPAPKANDVLCHRRARELREGLGAMPAGDTCGDLADVVTCPLVTGAYERPWWTTAEQLHDLVAGDLAMCGALRWRDSRTQAQAHLWLAALAARWPERADADRWLAFADAATASWRTAEVEAFALDALDNAIAASKCDDGTLARVRDAALALRDHADHDASLDGRIAAIAAVTPAQCRARR